MGISVQLHVFAYDITDDRRRAKVARLLEHDAARVQDSVFEALISRSKAERITRSLEVLLRPGDRLRVYAVPMSELDRVITYGGAPVQRNEDCWLL